MRRVFGLESGWQRLKGFYFAIPARRARPASVIFNTFKTLVQSGLLWLVFLGVGPFCAFEVESKLRLGGWPVPRFGVPLVGCVSLFCGGWLVAWSSAWVLIRWGQGTPLPLDATNRLVVRGPYRWIRNPMACASLVQGVAVGLALGSPLVLLYVLCGALMWNTLARPWEEADMEARFGVQFQNYKQAVRCWLPRLYPYSPDEPNTASSTRAQRT